MKIYLDNCVFNRPFDKQVSIRIKLEAEAKLYIQSKIKEGFFQLIWSDILEFENDQNPFFERKCSILNWKQYASMTIEHSEQLKQQASELTFLGIKMKDALHVVSAISANADYFLSTDDKLLKKLNSTHLITALNPMGFIGAMDYDAD